MARGKRTRTTGSITTTQRRPRTDRALAAHLLARLKDGEDVRTRKARRVRAAIKVGVYENDLKFRVALERLIGELR